MHDDDLDLDFGTSEYVRFHKRGERRPSAEPTRLLPTAETPRAATRPSRTSAPAARVRRSARDGQAGQRRALALKIGGGVAVAAALVWSVTVGLSALHVLSPTTANAAGSAHASATVTAVKRTASATKKHTPKKPSTTASAAKSSVSHVASTSSATKVTTAATTGSAKSQLTVAAVTKSATPAKKKAATHKAAARAPNSRGTVTIETFGYSFAGPPSSAKLVADVRNIQVGDFSQSENGLMASVRARVMASPVAQAWLKTLENTWTPQLKNGDLVAVGCARGHHRSVTIAYLYQQYLEAHGWTVNLKNRDISKTW